MSKILIVFTALAAASLLTAPAAQASHQSPLSQAACAYRDAVVHFGHEVVADRRLTHFERRVAPQLVGAAGRMYVATRHPHQVHQLRSALFDIEAMHRQVELILFSHPGCPVYNALRPCWQDVLCAYNDLTRLLNQLGCHSHSHWHADFPPRRLDEHRVGACLPILPPTPPPSKLQSYRYRDTPIISYRYGTRPHGDLPTPSEPPHSPSERQIADSERHIERAISRRQLDHTRFGATLSRRMD